MCSHHSPTHRSCLNSAFCRRTTACGEHTRGCYTPARYHCTWLEHIVTLVITAHGWNTQLHTLSLHMAGTHSYTHQPHTHTWVCNTHSYNTTPPGWNPPSLAERLTAVALVLQQRAVWEAVTDHGGFDTHPAGRTGPQASLHTPCNTQDTHHTRESGYMGVHICLCVCVCI